MGPIRQSSKSNIKYPKHNQKHKKSTNFQKFTSISSKHMTIQHLVKFRFFYPKFDASSHFEYLKEVFFKLKVKKVS